MCSQHDVSHGMVCLLPIVCVSAGESVLGALSRSLHLLWDGVGGGEAVPKSEQN